MLNNCEHTLYYLNIHNKKNKECKCLSCGKILRIENIGKSLYIETIEPYEKVKELYDTIIEITDSPEIVKTILLEDL